MAIMLNHFSHEKHLLILKELQYKVRCYGCHLRVSVGSPTYCCIECNVFLHKSCAEAPLEITHPEHPQHPLQLFTRPSYNSREKCFCDICYDLWNGFTYHCSKCDYNVDVLCSETDNSLKHFKYISHKHQLILMELQEKVDCYGCKRPALPGSKYCCRRCKIFFHISCAEAPWKIIHPRDSEHPLYLHEQSYNSGNCDICKRTLSGLMYRCYECEINMDIYCANSNQVRLIHPGHPNHVLKLQTRSALFECDACGLEGKDESYYCTQCSIWIHKSCGSLVSDTLFKGHPHPLTLTYRFTKEFRRITYKCDICFQMLKINCWLYYCGPCRYFVHLKCITSWSEENEADSEEMTQNTVRLPVKRNLFAELIKVYSRENGILPQVKLSTEIKLLSHKHTLILSNVHDEYYEFTEDDQETICNACVEPISGTCYSCSECNYFIHSYCTHLPESVSYFGHPKHTLSLYCPTKFFQERSCTRCKKICNGFMYECKECDFTVDMKCVSLPIKVKHKSHKHLLVQGDIIELSFCNACATLHINDSYFSCEKCDYQMGTRCAILPEIVGHRWDKHPLILSFPPFYDHPLEFTCDICEEELHPKLCMYHCGECDNSFHPRCIPRFDTYLHNMKFGGKIVIKYHPHPLTFARKPRYKFSCDKCCKNLIRPEWWIYVGVFECEDCYFNICVECVDSDTHLVYYGRADEE